MSEFNRVIISIQVVLEDTTTPRTVRERLTNMINYLRKDGEDMERKKSSAISEVEDLSSDVNIPPYVRTQLYSIASQLEEIGSGD